MSSLVSGWFTVHRISRLHNPRVMIGRVQQNITDSLSYVYLCQPRGTWTRLVIHVYLCYIQLVRRDILHLSTFIKAQQALYYSLLVGYSAVISDCLYSEHCLITSLYDSLSEYYYTLVCNDLHVICMKNRVLKQVFHF